jgi:hypothetical protein
LSYSEPLSQRKQIQQSMYWQVAYSVSSTAAWRVSEDLRSTMAMEVQPLWEPLGLTIVKQLIFIRLNKSTTKFKSKSPRSTCNKANLGILLIFGDIRMHLGPRIYLSLQW